MAISASQLVNIVPRVLSGTGNDLVFNGLFITENNETPTNKVLEFSNAQEVGEYFGLLSDEYKASVHYFNGFTNSDIKPTKVLFYRHTTEAVAPFLRGGNIGETSSALAQLKKIKDGILTLTFDKTVTINSIDLSEGTSLSNIAELLQNAIQSCESDSDSAFMYATVTYSSLHNAFTITSGVKGKDAPIQYASGNVADAFKLTEGLATISQGDNENLTTAGKLTSGNLSDVIENIKEIEDGSFKITIDNQELTISELNFKKFYIEASSGTMVGKATGDVLEDLKAISDGSIKFNIDGSDIECTALNFSSCSDMQKVADEIVKKLNNKATMT